MTSHHSQHITQQNTAAAYAADVPFELRSIEPAEVCVRPVSGGLCLPKGRIFDVAAATIRSDTDSAVAQTQVLSRWSDGSIRWLLTSWIAESCLQNVPCLLHLTSNDIDDQVNGTDAPRVILRRNEQRFVLQHSQPHSSPPVFTEYELTPHLIMEDGSSAKFDFGNIITEVKGPLRSAYCIEGRLVSDQHISLQLRFDVWPTIGLVQVQSRLRNSQRAKHKGGLWDLGDPGSFHFTGLQLDATLQTCAKLSRRWKSEDDSVVRQQSASASLRIVQRGSGGPEWASTNHVAADGQSTVSVRGYEATDGRETVFGDRSEPVVTVEADDSQLTMVVPEFWQKCPSSLSGEGRTLCVGIFPDTGFDTYELQGGEQTTQSVWLSTERNNENLTSLKWVNVPASMIQPAEWIQQCGVFDWFSGAVKSSTDTSAAESSHRYTNWVHEATTDGCSIEARRQTIDEYGWRNFGDIPANHEQKFYAGSNTIVSHYNNQFDLVYGGIVNLMVSGDPAWRELFDPLARHVMDIDIYHTQEDRPVFNGGLFWHTDHYVDAQTATHRTHSEKNIPEGVDYGGGPGSEHNYTTGLLQYYYLTGNPEAAASVRSLADWVFGMEDGAATVFGLLDDGPTGDATATVDYHGPGRASGNSINALLDGWELTTEDRYLEKAEELIRRVVHPEQNIEELTLLDAEYHWSYTVCLSALGRYLARMEEANRRGSMYDYVRRTLDHYGRWMAGNERPTLSKPEILKYVTEAWAAQDFRKANVLRIAASCCDDSGEAVRMRQKADELNDAAWKDLYSFGDRHLTARCFSIVMTEGVRDLFHRNNRNHQTQPAEQAFIPSEWTMFVDQKGRVKQLLKSPHRLLSALPGLLSLPRWKRTLVALLKRF